MAKEVTVATVDERIWDVDDTYLSITVQVDAQLFKKGEKVNVTIESIPSGRNPDNPKKCSKLMLDGTCWDKLVESDPEEKETSLKCPFLKEE